MLIRITAEVEICFICDGEGEISASDGAGNLETTRHCKNCQGRGFLIELQNQDAILTRLIKEKE